MKKSDFKVIDGSTLAKGGATGVTGVTEYGKDNGGATLRKDGNSATEGALGVTGVTDYAYSSGNYEVDARGVYCDGTFLAGPLKVEAKLWDASKRNWLALIAFVDRDGSEHRWLMPLTSLVSSSYRVELLNQGLKLNHDPKAAKRLTDYIEERLDKAPKSIRHVSQAGWHDRTYVLPNRTFGPDPIIFYSESNRDPFRAAGDLEGWRKKISGPCRGNSRLTFAVSSAFAGPLLKPTGTEGGGVHLKGGSAIGKTVGISCAHSVWSGPRPDTWNGTANGIEAVAAERNDGFLALDEISEASPEQVGRIVYMLGNGSPKNRMNANITKRERESWRLVFLSSGEYSLDNHMSTSGKRTTAGMEVRLLYVPADAGVGKGFFENLHGFDSGSAFADHLQLMTSQNFGTAGCAFLEKLQPDYKTLHVDFKYFLESFEKLYVPPNADGQVFRAAKRFALIAFAGELATKYGITGWETNEAVDAAARCFRAWLKERGGSQPLEKLRAIKQIRHFIEKHGDSRFAPLDEFTEDPKDELKTINRAGFRKRMRAKEGELYLVFPGVFERELCEGLDERSVKSWLAEEGLLMRDNNGKFSVNHKVPGAKQRQMRFVTILPDVLSWEEGSDSTAVTPVAPVTPIAHADGRGLIAPF